MTRHVFQCNPEDEVTTRRGTDTSVASFGKSRRFQIQLDNELTPHEQLDRQASSVLQHKTRPDSPVSTPQGHRDMSEMERNTEVPASTRGEALFKPAALCKESRGAPGNAKGDLTSLRR